MGFDSDSPDTLLKKISATELPPSEDVWPWPEEEVPRSSDHVHISDIPYKDNIRTFYLSAAKSGRTRIVPPPLISVSEFVPPALVEHLMRKKRPSALGNKFEYGEEITNMEGLMHTFVVPVVPRCETAGDYCFSFGHRVTPPVTAQKDGKKVLMTRSVVMSATIHMDFELGNVMLELCRLRGNEVIGKDLNADPNWKIPSKADKQNTSFRNDYDESLRQHMVYHLMSLRRLPAVSETENKTMTLQKALSLLDTLIKNDTNIPEQLVHQFVKIGSRVLSLEILFKSAFQLVRNEFSALEALCPQGYVYTYDPASIFAAKVGAEIMNRLVILGLKHLASHSTLSNLQIFGFNNYADAPALGLVKSALASQPHVLVVAKAELFQAEDGRFEGPTWKVGKGKGNGGRYDVGKWQSAKGAMLVVHNNSDAFGQNVETEGMGGSLDGAIGESSSAAGSLERRRGDLLDWVV